MSIQFISNNTELETVEAAVVQPTAQAEIASEATESDLSLNQLESVAGGLVLRTTNNVLLTTYTGRFN